MASIAEYVAQGFPYAVAYEKNANDRARVDFYESAAHKEMYANERAKADGYVDNPVTGQSAVSQKEEDANTRAAKDIDPRTGAKFVSAAAKENYANEQSRLVLNPITGEYFTDAADYEIEQNRLAREKGYLNAADYESGLRTRSYDKFVDPRDEIWTGPPERYHMDTANLLKYNPDQIGHPDYDKDWKDKYDAATDTYILDKPTGDGTTTGAAGSMDLAAFRPWTQQYWNQFMPKTEGLLYMQKPQRDYGLAYLPGEMRDPAGWGKWADDHKGHIPGGGWRFRPEDYTVQTDPKTGKLYPAGKQPRAPWHFTSGEAQATNIYDNPWRAAQMNLTPAQGAKWKGLLTGLDTAPAIDTSVASLLGVK
jgi:hypothetical protein